MDKRNRKKKTVDDTVCEIHKFSGYAVLSNCFVRSTKLGCPAIGLLGRVMDLPPTWNFSKAGLIALCPDGETAIDSALKNLKECGYLEIEVKMPNENPTGRIQTVYKFYEYSAKDTSIPQYDYELETFKRGLKLNNYRLPSINIKKKSYTCDINEIDDYIKNLIADGTISADDGFGNDISSGIYRDNSMQIKTAGNYNIPLTLKNAFADTANQTISVKVTGKLETYTVTLTTETVTIKKNSVFAPNKYIASATDRKGEDVSEQVIYNSEVDLTTVGRYKVYYYIVGKDDEPAATLTVVVTD